MDVLGKRTMGRAVGGGWVVPAGHARRRQPAKSSQSFEVIHQEVIRDDNAMDGDRARRILASSLARHLAKGGK